MFERLEFRENPAATAREIADLRQSVGWNRMEASYRDPRAATHLRVACYDGARLVGYVEAVGNNVTDAYIQDLMVHPDYQKRGVGTGLMNRVIARLKADGIYAISVLYEARLHPFYKHFGFIEMRAGQIITRHEP
ncbi:MAG: GNAT family N-acetyltransferase [Kiritimatiellaeota bacterium]|nr:GNAT family N-acetyltransferase [Kiritimatiellota bacterium]